MKQEIYTLKDIKMKDHGKPLFENNTNGKHDIIKLNIKRSIKAGNIAEYLIPDLELWNIGTYDSETGKIESKNDFIITVEELSNEI